MSDPFLTLPGTKRKRATQPDKSSFKRQEDKRKKNTKRRLRDISSQSESGEEIGPGIIDSDIDVPLDVAEYAEGQRIVSSFVLSEVQDGDKKVPQYLLMLTDNKDGLPWDFNQIRVFTWNLKRHRYETAYRERNLVGMFPVTTGTAEFGKEGVEPVFTLRVKDDQGKVVERKYRMIGPIVRRIMSPEEQQKEAAEKAARRETSSRKRRR